MNYKKNIVSAGGTQKINLLHKAGGRVACLLGKDTNEKLIRYFFYLQRKVKRCGLKRQTKIKTQVAKLKRN